MPLLPQGYSVMPGQLTVSLNLMNSTKVSADRSTAVVQVGASLSRAPSLPPPGRTSWAAPRAQSGLPLCCPFPVPAPVAAVRPLIPPPAALSASACAQTGSRLGQLYYNVWDQTGGAKAAVGGTCPPVGTAGLLSGGGIGFLTRQYGLACDQILALKMVGVAGAVSVRLSVVQAVGTQLR